MVLDGSALFTSYELGERCSWTHESIKAKLIETLGADCFEYMSDPSVDDYNRNPGRGDGTCFELEGGGRARRPSTTRDDPHKNYDSFNVHWKDFLACPGGDDDAWDRIVARVLEYSSRWEEGWRKVRNIVNYGDYLYFCVSGYSYEHSECFPGSNLNSTETIRALSFQ